jgi:hypothetical protein
MAFIIVFSNIWGLMLREWKGAGKRVYRLIALGLAVLGLSTLVVGLGNYLKAQEKAKPEPAPVTMPAGAARPISSLNRGALHDGT